MTQSTLFFAALAATATALARQISVPPLPPSTFLDTEAVTNIALHAGRSDAASFNLRLRLDGTPSNNLEVAFGRDANTNGVLEAEETATIYGWRGGRHFIEDAVGWTRMEEVAAVTNAIGAAIDILVVNDSGGVPKSFSAIRGGEPAFAELAANPPPWLFRREWDLVRVARRGECGGTDALDCIVRYDFLSLRLH